MIYNLKVDTYKNIMNIIVRNFEWIMLFAGVITCTTLFAVIRSIELNV